MIVHPKQIAQQIATAACLTELDEKTVVELVTKAIRSERRRERALLNKIELRRDTKMPTSLWLKIWKRIKDLAP